MTQLYRYLPLSDDARARGLYVLAVGSARMPPGMPYPPLTHPQHHRFHWHKGRVLQEYQMVYITRGAGMLESMTGGLCQVHAGDLFLLFPGEWHRYSPDPATGWDEHWVAFQGRRVAELLAEQAATPEEPVFRTDINDSLLREFIRVEEEVAEEALGYQGVAAVRIQLILTLAIVSHRRRSFQALDVRDVVKRAQALLRERIGQPTDMEALASELQVGYSWLRKVFRQYTGLPPAQYQMQLRLNHACDLLQSTPLPIAAIGCRSGFESAYYFARVFRQKIGSTPSEFRLQSRCLSPAADPAA